jgi:signal transduction histidine kinase
MIRTFLCSLVLLSLAATAQKKSPVDSLLKQADIQTTDTGRMKIYNQIGKFYIDNNATKAIEYFEKAKAIAAKEGLTLKMANNFYSIGYCYLMKVDFEKSLYNYQQSEKYYEQLKDSIRLTNALLSIGNIYADYKKDAKTAEYFKKAERLALAMNDSLNLSNVYDGTGTAYDRAGKLDSALFFLQKSYDIAIQLNDSNYAMNSLSNIGLTLKHLHRDKEAIGCFEKVLEYFERRDFAGYRKGILFNNIGATYAQLGDYEKALQAFNKSLQYGNETDGTTLKMENYRNMADMFGSMKRYKEQADYLTRYYHLKDSLFNLETQNRVTELESDYQLAKKDAELAKGETELGRQKSQRNLFIVLAIAAVVLLAALWFFFKRIKKSNTILTEKNEQINQQKNELQALNQVKDRLFSIISHDLRNPLATLRSYLSLTSDDSLPAEKKQQFRLQTMNMVANTSDMLDNLLAWASIQVKNMQVSITPINLPDCVADTVHNVMAQAAQKQITIQQQLTAETALGDYNILSIAVRNLLTNAIKFSQYNSSIQIESIQKNGYVLLSVADDGIGMSKTMMEQLLSGNNTSTEGTAGEKGSGLGLFLVKELLQKINAELLIESREGEGSKFIIVMAAQ